MKTQEQGFTLIELLVVVLIIGILAAVALPQYQVVVVKSRVGAMLPLMVSLAQAQETYYLENGEYTLDVNSLYVNIPEGCTQIEDNSDNPGSVEASVYTCANCMTLAVQDNGGINLNYCPDDAQDYASCLNARTVHVAFRSLHYANSAQRGQRRCITKNDSNLAKAVCASLGLIDANQK